MTYFIEPVMKPTGKMTYIHGSVPPEAYMKSENVYIGNPQYTLPDTLDGRQPVLIQSVIEQGVITEFLPDAIHMKKARQSFTVDYGVTVTLVEHQGTVLNPIFRTDYGEVLGSEYYVILRATITGRFKVSRQMRLLSHEWSLSKPKATLTRGDGSSDRITDRFNKSAVDWVDSFGYVHAAFDQVAQTLALGLMDPENPDFDTTPFVATDYDRFIRQMNT